MSILEFLDNKNDKNEDKVKFKTGNEDVNKAAATAFRIFLLFLFIYFLFGAYAAYHSWNANKKIGWSTGYRVLFSLFALIFPFNYLVIYLTYKSDLLLYIKRTKTEFIDIVKK